MSKSYRYSSDNDEPRPTVQKHSSHNRRQDQARRELKAYGNRFEYEPPKHPRILTTHTTEN